MSSAQATPPPDETATQTPLPPQPTKQPANPYDEVPYPDLSYAQTHPDRLAMLGRLLGLSPRPVEQCRVLELGSAGGGNLLGMALHLPKSRFVGVDYSPIQISMGERRIQSLGITNLKLICMDIADPDPAQPLSGTFDYIIAHGLYSWVPAPVRDAMFRLIKRHLAPQGIAFVSYNALPGWHIQQVVREAMLFHARNAETSGDKVAQAKAIIEFLANHIPDSYENYRHVFQRYQKLLSEGLKGSNAAFLLHDELETNNDAVYFRDFVEHAQRFELRYFVEAELANVLPHIFGQEVMQQLQQMATTSIEMEQYMDFLRNRMFRQSLLCHPEAEPTRMLRPDPVMHFYIRSEAAPETALAFDAGGKIRVGQGQISFKGPEGSILTTDHPISHAAFHLLRQAWPRAIHFDELFQSAHQALGDGAPNLNDKGRLLQERMVLAGNLLRGHGQSLQLVNLHTYSPAIQPTPSKRPQAAPGPRFEAGSRTAVTNLWHERVQLDEPRRQLLLLLDGTKPVEQIEPIWRVALAHAARTSSLQDAQQKYDALVFQDELAWLARASLLIR